MTTELLSTLTPSLPPGYTLQEYDILSVLGIGGFGITYLATDKNLQHKVAIKEFFPSTLAVRDHRSGAVALRSQDVQNDYSWGKERFVKEAQTLARFHHKNIVQVFRYFEGNGTGYMVMAFEDGKNLEQTLAEAAAGWDEAAILRFILPLLDGLQAIHQAGFLHRDIKPHNILVRDKDGSPVLIDFGSARSAASTHGLTTLVTPGYAPPEQYYEDTNQGPWSDIYSLAGVLYRAVTGIAPTPALQRLKKDSLLPAATAMKGQYSAGFLQAIDAGLNVTETQRPQSVEAWRTQLTGAAAPPLPASLATTVKLQPARAAGLATTRSNEEIRAELARRRAETPSGVHPMVWLLGFLVVLSALIYATRPTSSPVETSIPAAAPRPLAEPVVEPSPLSTSTEMPKPADPAVNANPVPAENLAATRGVQAEPREPEISRGPPQEAFIACTGKGAGASCSFSDRRNPGFSLTGTCFNPPPGAPGSEARALVCRPDRMGPPPMLR